MERRGEGRGGKGGLLVGRVQAQPARTPFQREGAGRGAAMLHPRTHASHYHARQPKLADELLAQVVPRV